MDSIRVPPEVVDKALAVLVDERRAVLAVWKGRGRVDLYDFAGTWHKVSHPYPRQEEGLWSRDDVLRSAAKTLASARPPVPVGESMGPVVQLDMAAVSRAQLIRATSIAYALWFGGQSVEIYSANGLLVRTIRVPAADVPTMSQLMHDVLEVCDIVVELHTAGSPLPHLAPAHR